MPRFGDLPVVELGLWFAEQVALNEHAEKQRITQLVGEELAATVQRASWTHHLQQSA